MLLERDEQLAYLTELLDQTDSDGGRVVLIRGEAGIGKSALVKEFLSLQADRAHTLVGYCDDLLTPHPLGPFWDLADEVPTIAVPLEAGNRLGVLRATLDLLSRELRPTVIVIEDTQWADDATIDAARYLGRRIKGTKGLLALTFRDSAVDRTHPLRQVIGELDPGDVARVHLPSLSHDSVASLIRNSGADLDPNEVFAMTNGNPLFATELVASARAGLPVSISDSVLARASKLSPKAREVLDLVSVIPGEADRTRVLRLTKASDEALAECVAHGLLAGNDETVFFRHELTRRTVESELTEHDRRRLNEAVLGDLGEDGDLARIVHHAQEAHNAEALVQFAPRAARAAAAVGSYQEAIANYRSVEPLLGKVPIDERAAIYTDWACVETLVNDDAAEITGIVSEAIGLYRQIGNEFALARSLVHAAELNDDAGKPEAVDECIDEALRILESHPPSPELAAAVGRKAFVGLRRGHVAVPLELADRALSLADELGDETASFNALNAKGFLEYAAGEPSGLDLLEEARRRAVVHGDDSEEVRALLNSGYACMARQELQRSIKFLQQAMEASIQANLPSAERLAAEGLAKNLLFTGDWDRAEDLALQESSRPYSNLATPTAHHVLIRLGIRKGLPETPKQLAEAWTDAEERMSPARGHLSCARAELMWIAGTLDSELAEALRQTEGEIGDGPWDGEMSFWLWMAGDRTVSPSNVPEQYGLAMGGAPEEAAKQWERLGMPYEKAVAMVLCDGPEQLEGLELLESLGATATASRCRQMLRSRGVQVPRGKGQMTREHPVGLTARQDEVLRLLAEDLTDSEIADRLFVSTRTVNHHVSAVLSKLGVSSRTEAAEQASALGLLN